MEDYSQPDNDKVDFTLEDYSQPDNDAVNFTPEPEADGKKDAGPGPFDLGTSPVQLPLAIDLPTAPISVYIMNTGIAIFILGTISILYGVTAWLRNYAAGILLSFAVLALVLSGLLGIGLEMFWVGIMGTVLLLALGMVVRWM